jgi:hypothetical protein
MYLHTGRNLYYGWISFKHAQSEDSSVSWINVRKVALAMLHNNKDLDRKTGANSAGQPALSYCGINPFKHSCAPVLTDSVSAVSVIRGLPRPEKIGKLKK